MKIAIHIKSAGKRRPVLDLSMYEIPDDIYTAEALIAAIVRDNVRKYNSKEVDVPIFKHLSKDEVRDKAEVGKVSFGDRKNENQQNEEEAVANALQCYKDGIFLLLIDGEEIPSEQGAGAEEGAREGEGTPLLIAEGSTLTFIKLVMLAGRRW